MSDEVQILAEPPALRCHLHRPAKLNALTEAMLERLLQALAEAGKDPAVRAVILTGEGRAFCAGADVAGYATADLARFATFQERGAELLRAIEEAPVPVLAAVEGLALGGGFELALACDLIFAGPEARFGLPELGLGLIPGGGGTQRLAQAIGRSRTKELLWSRRQLTAAEAERLGLVAAVVPDPLAAARAMAEELARLPRLAVAAAKRVVNQGAGPAPALLALERATLVALFATPEGQEGIRAFVEKRPPKFEPADS